MIFFWFYLSDHLGIQFVVQITLSSDNVTWQVYKKNVKILSYEKRSKHKVNIFESQSPINNHPIFALHLPSISETN